MGCVYFKREIWCGCKIITWKLPWEKGKRLSKEKQFKLMEEEGISICMSLIRHSSFIPCFFIFRYKYMDFYNVVKHPEPYFQSFLFLWLETLMSSRVITEQTPIPVVRQVHRLFITCIDIFNRKVKSDRSLLVEFEGAIRKTKVHVEKKEPKSVSPPQFLICYHFWLSDLENN